MDKALMPFEGRNIKTLELEGTIWFSIVDIIAILTDSPNPSRYWADLKRRAEKENGKEVFAFCEPLKVQTAGDKQNIICANTEGGLRTIQSVFKDWKNRARLKLLLSRIF
jgi:DNA-damage-inducible protein D